MRPEQPTVPDPDPLLAAMHRILSSERAQQQAAMRRLLSSDRAQQQAAQVLRDAGWSCHAPGEVYWLRWSDTCNEACRDGVHVSTIYDHRAKGFAELGVFITGMREHDINPDHDYGTPEAARAAVEKALKGETNG